MDRSPCRSSGGDYAKVVQDAVCVGCGEEKKGKKNNKMHGERWAKKKRGKCKLWAEFAWKSSEDEDAATISNFATGFN